MGLKSASEVEGVLADLCIQHGYCLPAEKIQALVANPPIDAESFVDAVLIAEGLTPESIRRGDRMPMVNLVEARLFSH